MDSISTEGFPRLTADFYMTDGLTLARACLGKLLVCRSDEGILAGIISETEAYMGVSDRAGSVQRSASTSAGTAWI